MENAFKWFCFFIFLLLVLAITIIFSIGLIANGFIGLLFVPIVFALSYSVIKTSFLTFKEE